PSPPPPLTPSPTAPPAPTHRPIYLPAVRRPDALADRVAYRLMAMLDRPAESGRLVVWDWEAGVGLVGLMTAYSDGRDPRVLRWVDDWLSRAVREGWVDPRRPALRQPNDIVPAWGALLRDRTYGDDRHGALFARASAWLVGGAGTAGAPRVALPLGVGGADLPAGWPGAWSHLPDRPEVWDDTLFMAAPFLARYGQGGSAAGDGASGTADVALAQEAARQVIAHAAVLQDPSSGLWFHGWSAAPADAAAPHMSGGYWARGNAWAALATTEVIDSLPADDPLRTALRDVLVRQLTALARLQAPSGLWHTEVTRPDYYTETSGSAGIAAALYRAIAAGWLPPALRATADRAYGGVVARIAADGAVTGVSAGTGVPSAEQGIALYNRIDASRIQPYGQGLALLLFEARERADAAARRAGEQAP
ncbi:MAG: glycoside hydrolase family 88 protein, partial [Ardenticatenales bacterium]